MYRMYDIFGWLLRIPFAYVITYWILIAGAISIMNFIKWKINSYVCIKIIVIFYLYAENWKSQWETYNNMY